MISVITYGRNDSYDFNLHKRAALSLNCLAEVLDAPDDEILFVDYNTPDELPSFPEAIADTLTSRARGMLRILRIRPDSHRRYAGRTHLGVIEPVARNVALRRSEPANRWILSTNTDMILAPTTTGGLSTIVAGLADGYYHLPRFELPQSLWQSLDRHDPREAIARAVAWSRALNLSEVVRNGREYLIYDGPGDFQLMLRRDLLAIHGFDERILLGWHVDANVARRLSLLHGPSGDLAASVSGYHCEHTRTLTPKHLAGRPENDFSAVVEQVTNPIIEEQDKSFGLAGDAIEEIRLLEGAPRFLRALLPIVGTKTADEDDGTPPVLSVDGASFDLTDYDPRHVLPFLMDALANHPRDLLLGWFGAKRGLLEYAAAAWCALGFTQAIRVAGPAPWLGATLPEGATWCAVETVVAAAGACIFDFGSPDGRAPGPARQPTCLEHAFVLRGLRLLAATEAVAEAAGTSVRVRCRVIAVNAANTRFSAALSSHAAVTLSPVTTRIRQGFVQPIGRQKCALLPLMWVAEAGRRLPSGDAMVLIEGTAGMVCAGPNLDLLPGRYCLTFELDAVGATSSGGRVVGVPPGAATPAPLTFEVSTGDLVLARRRLSVFEEAGRPVALEFGVTEQLARARCPLGIEAVLRTAGGVRGTLRGAWLETLPGEAEPPAAEQEWLAVMSVGRGAWASGGRLWRRRPLVRAATGEAGHVVFGPYVGLTPGEYEVAFTLNAERAAETGAAPIQLEVLAGGRCLAKRTVAPAPKGPAVWCLPMTLDPGPVDADGRMALEFRVWTDGSLPFAVLSVRTRRLGGAALR